MCIRDRCKGGLLRQGNGEPRAVYGDTVVIGTGRRGADWLEKICAEHHIAHKPGTVDIGVRVECRNEVCLLYTSDAADEEDSEDLGGRRINKKKKNRKNPDKPTNKDNNPLDR